MSWDCHRCRTVHADTTPSCWCAPSTSTGTSTEIWTAPLNDEDTERGQKAIELLRTIEIEGVPRYFDLDSSKIIGYTMPLRTWDKLRAFLKDGER